jgi:hypothetical protein
VIQDDLRLPRESIDYVYIPVVAPVGTDPTTLPVQIAFTADGSTDRPTTLNTAAWETIGGVTYARILVGSGGIVLAPGRWKPWWKVTANPEQPVRPATNMLIIT